MVRVSDEDHRKIFSILSHQKKQRIEIVKILEQYEGLKESSVDSLLDQCMKWYDDIEKEEKNGDVYYERTDVDQVPEEVVRPKKYANPEVVNDLLTDLESGLGLDEDGRLQGPTNPPDPREELLWDFSELTKDYKYIIHSTHTLERFLAVFDEYKNKIKNTYNGEDGTMGEQEYPTDTHREYRIFFQFTRSVVANSKKGQEPPEVGAALHKHLVGVDDNFSELPDKLCLEYQRLAREIDKKQGKKFFKSLVLNSNLEKRLLKREAFYTYDVHCDFNELVEDLSELADEIDGEKSEEMTTIANELAENYVRHPPNPLDDNVLEKI
jgi:hypothetical protein